MMIFVSLCLYELFLPLPCTCECIHFTFASAHVHVLYTPLLCHGTCVCFYIQRQNLVWIHLVYVE
jgi:hypothetical protein